MNSHHVISGMFGWGDAIRQRAIVHQRLVENETVWLYTAQPQIYQDMVNNPVVTLKLLPAHSNLRTQTKNIAAHAHLFTTETPPESATTEVVWYTHKRIRETGSFLRATLHNAGMPIHLRGYELPLPTTLSPRVLGIMSRARCKPIMLWRPLVARTEWGGCDARNPNQESYWQLYRSIRSRYFVVAVADIDGTNEWSATEFQDADVRAVHGELTLDDIIALTSVSALVFASPGFACILASALHRPAVMVCGGHEHSGFYAPDALAPFLGIDPIAPDDCFTHECGHDKTIDMPAAIARLQKFVETYA